MDTFKSAVEKLTRSLISKLKLKLAQMIFFSLSQRKKKITILCSLPRIIPAIVCCNFTTQPAAFLESKFFV